MTSATLGLPGLVQVQGSAWAFWLMRSSTFWNLLSTKATSSHCWKQQAPQCLAPDGRRYFYAHAQVDGRTLPLPHDHWTSRDAAVRGLAAIASGESKPAVA